jgi:hypothetical protein
MCAPALGITSLSFLQISQFKHALISQVLYLLCGMIVPICVAMWQQEIVANCSKVRFATYQVSARTDKHHLLPECVDISMTYRTFALSMQWQATLIENVQNRLNIIMRNTFAKDGNAQQVIQVKTRMENQRSYRKQNSQAIVDVKLVRIIRRIHALSIEY